MSLSEPSRRSVSPPPSIPPSPGACVVEVTSAGETDGATYPAFRASLPTWVAEEGPYRCRFATGAAELDAVLRLRFAVFNLELGEGLAESFASRRDEDRFDRWCHHLVVEERATGRIVGTYRMMTAAMAAAGEGFYTDAEFDLGALAPEVVAASVEVGRACIAREHRRKLVLYLLWRGLAAYVEHNRARYLFGCCSLAGLDPEAAVQASATLARRHATHPELAVAVRPEFAGTPAPDRLAEWPLSSPRASSERPAGPPVPTGPVAALPELFEIYLRYGGLVCGPPAFDRAFGTTDFLVQLDVERLTPRARRLFFGDERAGLAA